jgi:hypothetical protein
MIFLTRYYSDDQIKMNKMGGVCGTCGGKKSCLEGFGGET